MMGTLSEEFRRQLAGRAEKAEGRTPTGVKAAMDRFGWSAKDLAEKLGVSERTARRYRQQDRIPERRAEQRDRFGRESRAATTDRVSDRAAKTRKRIEQRGLRKMEALGKYVISKTRGQAGPGAPAKLMGTNKISPASMRDYFAAVDQGDEAAADEILNDALAEGYEAPGLHFTDVTGLEFGI